MYPSPFSGPQIDSLNRLHYYQGVLIAEVALTLLIFIVMRIIHSIKWGYDEEREDSGKKNEDKQEKTEEDSQSKKWDQKAWNVFFPIIFFFHVGAISLIIVFIPYIFSAVIGFLHFVCFIVLIILNTCIKDIPDQEKWSRTKGTRVVWGLMCLFNVMLIIGGLTGVDWVYSMPFS